MKTVELARQREDAMKNAERIVKTAEDAKRTLTPAESTEINKNLAYVTSLSAQIKELEKNDTLRAQFVGKLPMFDGSGTKKEYPSNSAASAFPEVAKFILTGNSDALEQKAALTESGGLAAAVPPFELQRFVAAYNGLAPFETAGATIFNSDSFGMVTIKVPFVLAGTGVTTYAEASGPNSTADATVVGVSLVPAKYAFLELVSEEADADIDGLGQALSTEGVTRVYQKTSDAATAALLSSLSSASATTSEGSDYLGAILDQESRIAPRWASPNNAFMLSRRSLSLIRNLRDAQDRPIFDVVSKTIIGYRTVINDACGTQVVFGNWAAGAYLSYSSMIVQRLVEQYRESGKIGIRFTRRMASAFFSDASSGSVQPLVSLDLTDYGS